MSQSTEETLPPPLVEAGVDLRDFAFMPLDVQRLRDSDLAADENPEACWAAVLLWCAAWHQVPAASIPDNDQWQAKQAGYAARGRIDPAWKKVRLGALRGWVRCSDGRLYHPIVAEKAREAWRSKLEQRWRTEASRVKKHNQRHDTSLHMPDFDTWVSIGCPQGQPLFVPEDNKTGPRDPPPDVPRETPSKGQGEGQGQGQGKGQEGRSGVGLAAAAATTRGARLPAEWVLPKAWGDWALAEFPAWTEAKVRLEAEKFADHWRAASGKAGVKADWLATWRNWCRDPLAQRDAPKPSIDTTARDAEARRLLGFVATKEVANA